MSVNRDNQRLYLNGIDLSGYVKDITFAAGDEPTLMGFPLKEIAITGEWWPLNFSAVTCGICGQSFVPGQEGTPTLRHHSLDHIIPACPDCVVPLIEQGIIGTA